MIAKEYKIHVDWNSGEVERRVELLIKQLNGTLQKSVLITQKPQEGYSGESENDILDDVKVTVKSATATSFQQGEGIEKSIDGDLSTFYHSAWNNSREDYFPITLDYHFEDQERIDYLVYHPRSDGGVNGHFKEVEIWVATQTEPSLVKQVVHDFKGSGSAARIGFSEPLMNPTTIRFIVKSGTGDGQGFASCAEMEFFQKNPDNFDPSALFSDMACTRLRPDVTLEEIKAIPNSLYRNIAFYLFTEQYPGEFRIQEYNAWPHPDDWAKENKTSTLSLLDNPTGMSVVEGEELIVFADETNGYPLSLKIQDLDTPGRDGYNNASFYPLSPGVNKIIPRNKGLIYLFYHTPDYRNAPPVTVHFATGTVNGYYDSQKHDRSDWARLLGGATNKHFDVLGKYAHLTFETAAFISYASNDGPPLIDAYDDLVHLEQDFMGIMKYDRSPVNRAYFHVMYTSYMYATSHRTAYESGTQQSILSLQNFKSEPWGPAHEVGHTFQTRPGFRWLGMTEVTNNVHSLYVQTRWGNDSRLEIEQIDRFNNRYEKAYYRAFVHGPPHPGEEDVFCKLVSLWQLYLYFSNSGGKADLYKDFYELIRSTPDKPNAGEQQLEFVRAMCQITQIDLTPFFTLWGYLTPYDAVIEDYGSSRFTVTQGQIDNLLGEIKEKNYAPMTDKIEYICDSNIEIFKNKQPVQAGNAIINGNSITMNGWKNVVAFEVYNNDQLVFVSNKNSFKLDNPATSNIKIYAVAFNGVKTLVQ